MTDRYDAPLPPPAGTTPKADNGRNASLVFGVILVVIGAWFFATETLGLNLPQLRWDQIWPIFLVGLGVWIVLGSFNRRG